MPKRKPKTDICFYCDNEAIYTQVVKDGKRYIFAEVCKKHLEMGLSA